MSLTSDDFDYRQMVQFMFEKWRVDMSEWEENFICSMQAKLAHPDAHAISKSEVAEFLSKNEKIKIVQVWNRLGL